MPTEPRANPADHRDLWWPSPTVELAQVAHLKPSVMLQTVFGAQLEQIQISYESWGELNSARDNAVLIVHPMTGDCHATGDFAGQPLGWWEPLIGPGRAIDTERHFVVCPNLIGGCYGTTGPRFPDPDGEPYLERFPLLTPLDMMRVQQLFLRHLGIRRLNRVIGPSMGGMIAWEWAIEAGEQVDEVVVVAAPLRTTALQIGLNWLQRRGIELDLGDDEQAAKGGRMIARGVGMLSYRASLGLEAKFGRDWFKQPGSTLKERGMYNIESWLRHHGKRSLKRFDPYTYLLFSRAMDLHDVGEGRGGYVAALDRVRGPVLVIGISSDMLYSAKEVKLGADVLNHLGRRVRYAEIRSPHGHDGFMLETDQLTVMLSAAPAAAPVVVPRQVAAAAAAAATTPPEVTTAEVKTVRLGILGAGNVAALFLEMLAERRNQHREDFQLQFEVAGVAEIDRRKRLAPIFATVDVTHEPDQLVARDDIDIILDLTRGTGSHADVEQALRRRRPVVTPNKLLIREYGDQLGQVALEHGVRLAYHNSIAASWPLLYSLERPLGRAAVTGIKALLSSTCNVVLEQLEQGTSLAKALAIAEAEGLTEQDPSLDLSGWLTVQKLLILVARTSGVRFRSDQVAATGITELDIQLVRQAPHAGFHVKLVGVYLDGGEVPVLGVQPMAVRIGGHLGGVHGESNVVVIEDRESGERVYLGKGAGDLPVASAVLRDLVGIDNPLQSWTGRYPPAEQPPSAPAFERYLVRDGRRAVVRDTPGADGVPMLAAAVYPEA